MVSKVCLSSFVRTLTVFLFFSLPLFGVCCFFYFLYLFFFVLFFSFSSVACPPPAPSPPHRTLFRSSPVPPWVTAWRGLGVIRCGGSGGVSGGERAVVVVRVMAVVLPGGVLAQQCCLCCLGFQVSLSLFWVKLCFLVGGGKYCSAAIKRKLLSIYLSCIPPSLGTTHG